jgi:TatD DNase family protein
VVPALIDVGANLTHECFRIDLQEVLDRARVSGVSRLIVTGTSLASSEAALELASSRPGVLWSTAGVHPHAAADYDDATEEQLRILLRDPRVVAAGECGLDYCRNFAPRDIQRTAFSRQLELAAASGRPVFLHQRDAHPDFLAVLAEQGQSLPAGVAHCFTNGPAEAADYLNLGLYIGITGWICDDRRAADLRTAVRSIPLDRLVVETDSPYLLPRSIRPVPGNRRNEPACLPEVVRTLAFYMGQSPDVVAEATTRNAERLFRLSVEQGIVRDRAAGQ